MFYCVLDTSRIIAKNIVPPLILVLVKKDQLRVGFGGSQEPFYTIIHFYVSKLNRVSKAAFPCKESQA